MDRSSSSNSVPGMPKKDVACNETNPDTWFDNSNHSVFKNRPAFDQNEPPFFLSKHDGSSASSPVVPNKLHLPVRSVPPAFGSHGSSAEEYRSVIDDLTVENQRLKKRLQRFERIHDSHLQDEKLFEVKVHGLSASKKRELEETLRKFASSIQSSPRSDEAPIYAAPPMLFHGSKAADKSDTSGKSSDKWADSGYGSMAFSMSQSMGNGSKSQSMGTGSKSQSTLASGPAPGLTARDDNNASIRTYLHDIPEGLLPKHTPAMTESSRRRLVVKRLEQIFDGRGASPGVHQQPQQQQEVSNCAASDERSASESMGHRAPPEGTREARIMDHETEDPMAPKTSGGRKETSFEREDNHEGQSPSSNLTMNEQRPTRPLDLDPDRAQVPLDNIKYIQHLGFLPQPNEKPSPATIGEDWIYLNLLIGMAQLHTLHVTPDFVQKAVAEYSSRFELSNDGRKIRWTGGRRTVDGPNEGPPMSPAHAYYNAKKRRLYESDRAPDSMPKRAAVGSMQPGGKWVYNPLFAHKKPRTESNYSLSVAGPATSSPLPGNVSGLTSGSLGTSSSRQDHGPIIFYQKATFCTDLSGDTRPSMQRHRTTDYISPTSLPLGQSPAHDSPSMRQGPNDLAVLSKPPSSEDVANARTLDIDFPPSRSSPKYVTFAEPEEHMEFEASGIGGVIPSDNFAISVIRQRTSRLSNETPTHKCIRSCSRLEQISERRPTRMDYRDIQDRILSASVTKLEPSLLPPATLDFLNLSDHDSQTSETSSAYDSRPPSASEDMIPPPLFPQSSTLSSFDREIHRLRNQEINQDEDMEVEEGIAHHDHVEDKAGSISSMAAQHCSPRLLAGGSQSEGSVVSRHSASDSVDFLAQARVERPDIIRAQEREYDAQVAERLAEEIPAGSSAATAGGGSGFGSPVCGSEDDEDNNVDKVDTYETNDNSVDDNEMSVVSDVKS